MDKMPNIPAVEWENASPEVREIYADIEKVRPEGLSRTFKAMANSVHVLRAEWERSKRLAYTETCLSYKLKQQIQVVVAKAVGCEGCVTFHSKALRNVGVSENEIKQSIDMDVNSPKDRVILEYAWKSAVDSLSVTRKDVDKLREVGLSNEEIAEVQSMIGLELTFANFFDSLAMEKDG